MRTQPMIENLYDLGWSRFRSWKHGPDFLPALKVLRCGSRLSTCLISGRRVISIECVFRSRQDARAIFMALEASPIDLRCFTAREQNSLGPRTHHLWFLQRLVAVAPALRFFNSKRMADQVECRQVLGQLRHLEVIVCRSDLSKFDAEQIGEWVSPLLVGPQVCHVVYIVSNWDHSWCRAGAWDRIMADADRYYAMFTIIICEGTNSFPVNRLGSSESSRTPKRISSSVIWRKLATMSDRTSHPNSSSQICGYRLFRS